MCLKFLNILVLIFGFLILTQNLFSQPIEPSLETKSRAIVEEPQALPYTPDPVNPSEQPLSEVLDENTNESSQSGLVLPASTQQSLKYNFENKPYLSLKFIVFKPLADPSY